MADRTNVELNNEIEKFIEIWDGTIIGYQVRNAYMNGTEYEKICALAQMDYEEWENKYE